MRLQTNRPRLRYMAANVKFVEEQSEIDTSPDENEEGDKEHIYLWSFDEKISSASSKKSILKKHNKNEKK